MVVFVAVLVFVAVVVVGFLLLVVARADVLMCSDADALRLFMSFSSNPNHDLPGALPQLLKKKGKTKMQSTRLETFNACAE